MCAYFSALHGPELTRNQVQTAIDTRTVDKDFLVRISVGRMACAVLGRLLGHAKTTISYPLSKRLKQHYTVHLFYARARLDLPTFEDSAVQRQLEEASQSFSRSGVAWDTFSMVTSALSTAVHITSEVSMLAAILKDQPDGTLLATISLSQSILDWMSRAKSMDRGHGGECLVSLSVAPFLEHHFSPSMGSYNAK